MSTMIRSNARGSQVFLVPGKATAPSGKQVDITQQIVIPAGLDADGKPVVKMGADGKPDRTYTGWIPKDERLSSHPLYKAAIEAGNITEAG